MNTEPNPPQQAAGELPSQHRQEQQNSSVTPPTSTVEPIVITLDNGQSYDILNPDNFTPTPTSGDVFGRQGVFIYRPDENDKSINDLVQITVFDSNGQNPRVFTTAEYTQYLQTKHKQGVSVGNTQNNRGIGIVLLILGLVIAALAFTVPIIRGRFGEK